MSISRAYLAQRKLASSKGYFFVVSQRTGQRFRIKNDFIEDFKKFKTGVKLPKIKIPVLIIHGDEDKSVPLSQSRQALKKLKGTKQLIVLKGFPHNWYEAKYYIKVGKLVASWFKKYL